MAQFVTNEELARINALYHKSKASGLTPEEQEEQRVLRQKYVASVRDSLRGTLNATSIQNPDGSIVHLSDKQKKEF